MSESRTRCGRMANDTRPGRKIRADESISFWRRTNNGKGSSTSGSDTISSSSLRRSARHTPSKEQVSSNPSNSRKSKRLEKQSKNTPQAKKQCTRVEDQRIVSSLRRSDRGKNQAASISPEPKESEKMLYSSQKKNVKNKKTVKELKFEAVEVSRREEYSLEPMGNNRKRWNGRSFRASFIQQRRRNSAPDANEDIGSLDNLQEVVSSDGGLSIIAQRLSVDPDSLKEESCSCTTKLNQEMPANSLPMDKEELEADVAAGLADQCDGSAQLKEILMDGGKNICARCNRGGKLLYCNGKGCSRSYHLSCLDPPPSELGVWHCIWCVKKKIESGVHSVSVGVDSIWDAREVEVQDAEGSQRQKQYFCKYKGLAHIHNKWVPETQLFLEAPLLVKKFNQKTQVMKWNSEWTIPHRLLKKRLLPLEQLDEFNNRPFTDISDCHYELLVKWRGLDYEHSTWELENVSFLQSPEGQELVREYESRLEKAKKVQSMVDKGKNCSLVKLSELGKSSGIDRKHLNSVNKLREYWHKQQNAVVIDEEERIARLILFILSVSEVCLPFLIIATSASLSCWEADFLRLAPNIDVIIYNGDKGTRRNIRSVEFYEEGGYGMFQVLLSCPEVVVEDLNLLECINWEAVIVDEGLHSGIYTHFEQIKRLTTNVRLVLSTSQMKDASAEYLNYLSLLDRNSDLHDADGSRIECNDNLDKLKERLSKFVVYDCKSDSSRFVEYWVPVQISNVQLEQYCSILLSNALSLSLSSKNDPVGVLRNIVISTRKCCDHPYIVDSPSLQASLTKDHPVEVYLDIGIKASGKLQLLDVMLSEMKKRQKRVLILFQSIGGSVKDSIGDILDDYIRQRFGPDSYERVDSLSSGRKQAAMTKFNKKENGLFTFLLEIRACHRSIKLTSVDAIIIFGGDWNPSNDLKALYRISVDSPVKRTKIFRLYSSFTIEEKILIANHGLTLDSNLQSISRSTIDTLLMWGATYLFTKLDEFHSDSNLASSTTISSEDSVSKDVVEEFLALLLSNSKSNVMSNSLIKEVQHTGGAYSSKLPLLCKQNIQLPDGVQPHVFWTMLLADRNPSWKYSSMASQRSRKRVFHLDNLPNKPEAETIEVGRKRKKMVANSADPATSSVDLEEGTSEIHTLHMDNVSKHPCSSDDSVLPEVRMVESEKGRTLPDAQRSLHLLLKPEILKLTEILNLSEEVKIVVGRFLEYVIENHRVSSDRTEILQAFQISACWIAASILKQKIDKNVSLGLAKTHLNFSCGEDEANSVYLKLRLLKKSFSSQLENMAANSRKGSFSMAEDITEGTPVAGVSKSAAFSLQNVKVEIEDGVQIPTFADDQLISQEEDISKYKIGDKEVGKNIKKMERKCEKRMMKLLRKQHDEIKVFNGIWEEKRAQLEKKHRLESAVVRSIHSYNPVRIDKLKALDTEFAKKLEKHKFLREIALKDLEAKQLASRNEENNKAKSWLAELWSCVSEDELHSHGSESGSRTGHCRTSGYACDIGIKDVAHVSGYQNEAVDLFINNDSLSSDLSTFKLCKVRPAVSQAQCDSSTQNLVEGSPSLTSFGMQDKDEPIHENQSYQVEVPSAQTVDTGPSDNSNDKVPSIEPSNELPQSVSPYPPVCQNQSDIEPGRVLQPRSKVNDASLQCSMITPQSVEDQAELPDQIAIQITNLELPPSDAAELNNQPGLDSSSRTEHKQNGVLPATSLSAGTSHTFVCQNQSEIDPGSVLQPRSEDNDASLQPSVITPQLFEDQDQLPDQTAIQTGTNVPPSGAEELPPNDTAELPLGNKQPCLDSSNRIEHQQNGELPTTSLCAGTSTTFDCPNQSDIDTGRVLQPQFEVNDVSLQPSTITLQLVEDQAELPDQIATQTGTNLELPPSDAAELPLGNNQPGLDSPSRIDHQQIVELPSTSVSAGTPNTLVEGMAELLNQAALQPRENMSIIQGSNSPLMHTTNEMIFQMPPTGLNSNPLQIEWERIHRETEQVIKFHEEMKVRLKADCDKEIEETIAQIRCKYEAKLQDAEAAFLLKKKELDTNNFKVHMNKLLAEAFRTKCVGMRPSGSVVMKQAATPVFMPQLHQLSLQPTPRHPPVVGLYLACQPASNQQITMPSTQAINQQVTTQFVQTQPQNSAVLSSVMTRPPRISPIIPSTGNLRFGTEIRAPAPHIQPFRPSVSMCSASVTSQPHGLPAQQPPNNRSTASVMPQPPSLDAYCRPCGPQSMGGLVLPNPLNVPLSSTELLMDIDSRPSSHYSNTMPTIPDLGSNFDVLDLSEFGPPSSAQACSISSASANDVVCLSDDD